MRFRGSPEGGPACERRQIYHNLESNMNRKIFAAVSLLALASCSPAQLQMAQSYHDKIASACSTAMLLAPLAPQISPWIVAACNTESAIAKLALDGNSLNWLQDLIAKARAGR